MRTCVMSRGTSRSAFGTLVQFWQENDPQALAAPSWGGTASVSGAFGNVTNATVSGGIANTGAVSLPMLFQIPKQEGDIDLLVRFKASRDGGQVTASPIDVSVVKR
jgi:hypothetical protein